MVSDRRPAVSGVIPSMETVDPATSADENRSKGCLANKFQPRLLFCLVFFLLSGCDPKANSRSKSPDGAASHTRIAAEPARTMPIDTLIEHDKPYVKKINLVYSTGRNERTFYNHQTPTPEGWEPYDGSMYTRERGYGWLTDLLGYGRDRGGRGTLILADGTTTSPEELGRTELANFQGKHPDNDLLVFRIDVPDGWYRVSCASVDAIAGEGKPLVDQRSFKCRAHDVVFAGANYGAPANAAGQQLIEGSGVVEATHGHLRIVVGDPAYAGWTWSHPGPWNKGWRHWWYNHSQYANGWFQILTRRVDPGFHFLGLNSLEIERVPTPPAKSVVVFRDFFNRDDNADINCGVTPDKHWEKVKLHPDVPDFHKVELYRTSFKFRGPTQGPSIAGLLQRQASLPNGIFRYSTRVSLFTGEGSRKRLGRQEAGIILLAEPSRPGEFNSTFVGVQFDSSRADTKGRLVYSVGDGQENYRTRIEVPDTALPFQITEGEFEIIVEHDVTKNVLSRIKVNGVDVTDFWSLDQRMQRNTRGLFGIRSAIHNTNPRVKLQQYFWYYRVEKLA